VCWIRLGLGKHPAVLDLANSGNSFLPGIIVKILGFRIHHFPLFSCKQAFSDRRGSCSSVRVIAFVLRVGDAVDLLSLPTVDVGRFSVLPGCDLWGEYLVGSLSIFFTRPLSHLAVVPLIQDARSVTVIW